MDHKTMHLDPLDPNHAMKDATALQHMIRNIKMVTAQDRKSRQKSIAMMAVQIIGIPPIGGLEHGSKLGAVGQKNLLALARPMLDVAGVAVVTALNLLQEDQIGLEFMQTSAQLMQSRCPPKSKQFGGHTLVNVIGGDPQRG